MLIVQPGPRVRAVAEEVRRCGGVVRGSRLLRLGHSKHTIAAAVHAGIVQRVRRAWVATPDADAHLLAAARAGVILSCVTQAERLGFWSLYEGAPHVAAHAHAGHVDTAPGTTVHRSLPIVPRHPEALADPIENVLVLVAACQPYESALVIWESALRDGAVDILTLGRLALPPAARKLMADASPFSDSGLETIVCSRLRWLNLPIVPQAWIAGHRVDFLIGDRLVLQIDGGHHVGAQRTSDNRHDTELMLRGYQVIRVGYAQVMHDWPRVQDTIMRAIAQGLHRVR
ncbi:very-short-patch-repair endonuclease [Microbacterium halimionae]|uniref:Very-short-patch-repair endonuclease n=1 Tax=Microbacterium halimionae TaxID=1526413 RepID=A0A7W3JLB8_9MICO|nr:DUF559 domain-containing protein [Microbacterium halimionae]MBA8814972.1 very-short-patch-repair endonuclease [Microbacterium halimionae]NII94237.1 very-short-patch-repair endonuclease [Microbacterium halimionae]